MFQRLSNSWELVKASAQVLKADKELMVFPLLSFLGLVVTCVLFFVPASAFAFGGEASQAMEIVAYVALFVFYVASTFVVVFFNSALVGAALIRLDGGDPTVADGLRIARQHLGSIFAWSVLAATVGMILRAARERSGGLGRIVIGMVGLAWNLATFLVVPVLVNRGLGPIDALKESATLLKRTWGEQIAGNLGIGAVFWVIGIVYTIIAVPIVILAVGTGSMAVIGVAVALIGLGYALITLVSATLSGIYSAALYRFATEGEVAYLDRRLLENAFVAK
ncbi:MAG: DUF6159 family protein [Acidobacteriota bacterium]